MNPIPAQAQTSVRAEEVSRPARPSSDRTANITFKLFLIFGVILVLHAPLYLLDGLRAERARHFDSASPAFAATRAEKALVIEGYRIVGRSLKYAVLVMGLVFTAFFLFERLIGLRLHTVHYSLVGAALCLFYLALLALSEVMRPSFAYGGAAGSSSMMIILYSAAILGSWRRAAVIAGLLAGTHAILYVILTMEHYALLAGTAALFVALGAVMFITRRVDWASERGMDAQPVGMSSSSSANLP